MSKLIDAIDDLDAGRDFVDAAYLAAHGLTNFREKSGLARVLGAAQDALNAAKAKLEEISEAAEKARP